LFIESYLNHRIVTPRERVTTEKDREDLGERERKTSERGEAADEEKVSCGPSSFYKGNQCRKKKPT